GTVSTTGRPSRRNPGPSGNPRVRPRRSSRWTTCMPPAFSTRTTAPHHPAPTPSTTRPGSASTGWARPLRGPHQPVLSTSGASGAPRTQREPAGAAPAVLQVDGLPAPGLLHPPHGAAPPRVHVLDDQAGLGLHGLGATPPRGAPVGAQHVGSVGVAHSRRGY